MPAIAASPRLYAPDSDGFERYELNYPLAKAFERFAIKRMKDRRTPEKQAAIDRDLRNYRVVVRRFDALMESMPIGEIDDESLATWRDRLAASRVKQGARTVPISPATVQKHWRYLRRVLKALRKDIKDSPRILEYEPDRLDMPRFVKQPGSVPVIGNQTWDALWTACDYWILSRNTLPAPLVGRGLLLLFYSTGLRAGDAWSVTWQDITLDPACPIQEVAFLEHEHGWLQKVCAKTKKTLTAPLTPPLRRWIDRAQQLLPARMRRGQLLPVGDPRTQSAADKRRQECRRTWMSFAGTFPYQFQHFRPAANNAWNAGKWGAGAWLLGHAANEDVNSKHYTNGIPILLEAVNNLKLPDSFVNGEL